MTELWSTTQIWETLRSTYRNKCWVRGFLPNKKQSSRKLDLVRNKADRSNKLSNKLYTLGCRSNLRCWRVDLLTAQLITCPPLRYLDDMGGFCLFFDWFFCSSEITRKVAWPPVQYLFAEKYFSVSFIHVFLVGGQLFLVFSICTLAVFMSASTQCMPALFRTNVCFCPKIYKQHDKNIYIFPWPENNFTPSWNHILEAFPYITIPFRFWELTDLHKEKEVKQDLPSTFYNVKPKIIYENEFGIRTN